MTTIRGLMLAQQARHGGHQYEGEPPTGAWVCLECDHAWPCVERVAADAVLATLDAADWQYDKQRLVPDPLGDTDA